jgi:polyhydroxyalkanoate synthesis regulator phasin
MAKKQQHEDGLKEFLERAQETFREAEENVLKAFKDLGERMASTQAEARKKVEELVANWPAKDLFDQFSDREHLEAKVNEVRHGLEHRLEEGTEAFWARLGLATKGDLQDIGRKLSALSKRVKELEPQQKRKTRAEA